MMLETMLLHTLETFVFYDAPLWYTMMIHFHTQIHYDSVLQCSTMFHTTLVHYDALVLHALDRTNSLFYLHAVMLL